MQLLFFGSLTDIAGKSGIELAPVSNTEELKEELFGRFPQLKKQSFVIAVNKKVVIENTSLAENDVVALMPPFSGG